MIFHEITDKKRTGNLFGGIYYRMTQQILFTKYMYQNGHNSFIHNLSNLETTQIYINMIIDEPTVAYSHNATLFRKLLQSTK